MLSSADVAHFREHGYVTVRGLLTPTEVSAAQATFNALASGELPIPGKDRGEHTPGLVNVTAFSLYHSLSSLKPFDAVDARAAAMTEQLFAGGPPMARDYEQLLRKLSNRKGNLFPPHQDMHYWPKAAAENDEIWDTRTATVSVAVNAASRENGCLWVLPGSHKSRALYPGCVSRVVDGRPSGGGIISLALLPEDEPRKVFLELAPGDATIHDEWLVHGSEGNGADVTRDTLILAYRAESMIAKERREGFRHSYNDDDDVLKRVREHLYEVGET
jgi:hypothetical protein